MKNVHSVTIIIIPGHLYIFMLFSKVISAQTALPGMVSYLLPKRGVVSEL